MSSFTFANLGQDWSICMANSGTHTLGLTPLIIESISKEHPGLSSGTTFMGV